MPSRVLIPIPAIVEPAGGEPFVLSPATVIHVPDGDERLLRLGGMLSDFVALALGPQPLRVTAGGRGAGSRIELRLADVPGEGDEAYELTMSAAQATIAARTPAGIFYGVQTFRQLLPPSLEHRALRAVGRPVAAPAVRIVDSPRFAWRGAMLDVARHFFSVADVKRYIDLMALHKMNRLHLHLTDDQGWRIEILSWPNLATHGGSRQVGGGPGGYFTQQDYRELVGYAAERQIVVVPEIDIPGHTHAALASYAGLTGSGEAPPLYTGTEVGHSVLCLEHDATWRFIEDVVREVAALTPGPYFHIGGDEVRALTPARYGAFIQRVQAIVHASGKTMIGWDEIASAPVAAGTIVQHWQPEASTAAAAAAGARIIMSIASRAYLDMKYDRDTAIGLAWAGTVGVRTAYDWDPGSVVNGVPEAALLGVEAPLWTETVANIRDAEFLAYPRLAAIAEVGWSRAGRRAWEDFRRRLAAQAPRWTALGINFYRSPEIPWE